VSFEVPGRVERVDIHRGDQVTAEQTVAKLDDAIERLTIDAHRQDANAAQADLALLEVGSRREDIASLADDTLPSPRTSRSMRASTACLSAGFAAASTKCSKAQD
jgi:multidrug efflux pump subunit AcrA (membrane-fusion protein)